MRAFLIAALVICNFGSASAQSFLTGHPYPRCQTQEVVVYTTSTCGYCRQVKQYLTSIGADFFEIDVEDSDNDDLRRIWRQGVPQIATERGWIRGFNVAAINAALCVQ